LFTYETLENLFEKYYDTRKLVEIREILIKPVLERSLKMGLDRDKALQAFIDNGILFIDKFNWQYVLINKFSKYIWGKTYNQLLIDFFVTSYVAYLKDIGLEVVDREVKETIGIIELLVYEGLGAMEIAYQLGLARRNDSDPIRQKARSGIRVYIKTKWKMTITQLFDFLKTNYLRPNEHDAYISNL
jgi:hypothetical protein